MRCLLVLFWLVVHVVSAAPMLVPGSGPVGTQVQVTLPGLDASAVSAAAFGNVSAPIVARSGETVTIEVPPGAKSGPITLISDSDARATPLAFEITRLVNVSVGSGNPGVTTVGSFFGNAAGGQVAVSVGRANLVFASNDGSGPPLLGIVTDAISNLELNANSTALAVLFLSSLVYTADSDDADVRLQELASLSETAALASYLAGELLAGRDYSEESTFQQRIEAALSAYVSNPPQPTKVRKAGASPASAAGYDTFDLKTPGYEKLNRIQPKELTTARSKATGLPVLRQKFGAAPLPDETLGRFITANPLEWAANLYALNISDPRLDTRPEVEALQGSYSAVYGRVSPEALDRYVIASEPATRCVDLVSVAKQWVSKKVVGAVGDAAGAVVKSELTIPDDAAGLYMVRAFNGARFPPQAGLLDQLPGAHREDRVMLTLNMVLAVNEAVAFFISAREIFADNEWAGFLARLEMTIGSALEVQAAQGTLDAAVVEAVFLASVKTAFEWAWDKLRSAGVSALPARLGGVLKSVFDASGKVASVFRLVERVTALSNAVQVFNDNAFSVQAIEDTIIVVGNPWAPHISGFHPQRGQRGSLVTITGDRFFTIAASNIVTIGYLGTSPEDPPAQARAEVVAAYLNSLVIRIPDDANTGVIRVHVAGRGTASTEALEPPYREFEVIPDPVLTAVAPGTVFPGQPVRLIGENLPPVDTPQLYAVFDIEFEDWRTPSAGNSNELVALAPFNTGTGTVRLRWGNRESNPIQITVLQPPLPDLGAEIRVSTGADGNVRDGELTLREALMLAAGTLPYSALTTPPSPRPPGVTYETDWVSSHHVGNGLRNQIIRDSSVNTITLTSPLPEVPSWSIINLGNVTLDGAGVTTGLLLNNSSNVQIRGVNLTGFSQAAIHVTGGSHDNLIDLSSVIGGAGHGVFIEGNAWQNTIRVSVSGVGGDGYRLAGANVMMNDVEIGEKTAEQPGFIEHCGGWGIRIMDSARFNRVMAPRQLLFGQPPPGAIQSNALGGILISGPESTGNRIHPMFGPGLPILGNGGPGIRIESPSTTVSYCLIGNNDGSGIEVAGTNAAGTRISACYIGFDSVTGAPQPNDGHGIHLAATRTIQIGEDFVDTFVDLPFNFIGTNLGHGIFLESCRDVTIRSTEIGRVHLNTFQPPAVDLPNAQSGIVLQNSSDCVIGSSWWHARVQVTGHLNGTGIHISGTGSHDNTVIGTFIGCEYFPGFNTIVGNTDLGNLVGIELVNGAWGNRIGMRGRGRNGTGASPMNYVHFNRTAGVIIDSGLDPSQSVPDGDEPFVPVGGNVVVNNSIQLQYETGVLLKSGAKATQIGGTTSELNLISLNGKVGIRIENASASRPELGNRIIGNTIFGNGQNLSDVPDPLTGDPEGVGILLLNSSGQRIGGDRSAEGNRVANSWVGIVDIGGSNNFIAWNNFDTLRKSAVILRDAHGDQLGPENNIALAGLATNAPIGAAVIAGGGGHTMIRNRIGSWRDGSTSTVTPDGLVLRDTAGNRIGGFDDEGNIFVNATGCGIRVTGAASTQNQIAGNWIGVNPGPGISSQPNLGGGIVFENGASVNIVGGSLPVNVGGAVALLPTGNRIHNNEGDGVRVSGAATVSNTILNNSITANSGLGIFLGGGNRNLPSPQLTTAAGMLNGTSGAPNGSIVQVFYDTGGEGRMLLGETEVVGGAFQFRIPALLPGTVLTATVTDSATGDTSPFASPVTIVPPTPVQVTVERVGTPVPTTGAPGTGATLVPIRFTVTGAEKVRVTRLDFDFTGTAPGALSSAVLYLDANTNSMLDPGEPAVGPAITNFSSGAEFTGSLIVVEPDVPGQLLLHAQFASNAVAGAEVEFALANAAAVTAGVVLGPTPVTVVGTFPILSDRATIGAGQPADYISWAGLYFSQAELDGIGAAGVDADGDRLSNLMEYFLGTHPRNDEGSPFQITREGTNGVLRFSHWNRADVTWLLTEGTNFPSWHPLTLGQLQSAEPLSDGRFRETVLFPATVPRLFFRLQVEQE